MNTNQFPETPQTPNSQQPAKEQETQPVFPTQPVTPATPSVPQTPTEPVTPSVPTPSVVPPQNPVVMPEFSQEEATAPIKPAYPTVTSYYPPKEPEEQPAPKKKSKGLRIMALVLAGVMVLIIGLSGGYLVGNKDNLPGSSNNKNSSQSGTQNQTGEPGNQSDFNVMTEEFGDEVYSYEQIVEKVSPSIVNITVYSDDGSAGSYASGIIMDATQGYVLTNDHIYADIPGAKFLITLNNKKEFKATFVSGDTRSDIAILKIENPVDLVAATFSSTPVAVGERVLAIGQSYGYADTVSEGIVSASNRRVSLQSGSYSEQYIQTTAAINPGNSGGALVNMAGQVVGVTSAKIASQEVEGLGFAIPSDKALSIVKNLQANGTVKGRAKLGITYTQVNTVAAEVNDLPVGIYVESVDSSCDISKKGVKKEDVITHVNGTQITNSTILLDIIEQSKAGDSLQLTVYHSATSASETITVILEESESTNSYQTASQGKNNNNKQDSHSQEEEEEESNDLPDSPYDFFFDFFGDN